MKTRNLKPKRTFWQRLTFRQPREMRHYSCGAFLFRLNHELYYRSRRAPLWVWQAVAIDGFRYSPTGAHLWQSLPAGMVRAVVGNHMSRIQLLWGDSAFPEMELTDANP